VLLPAPGRTGAGGITPCRVACQPQMAWIAMPPR